MTRFFCGFFYSVFLFCAWSNSYETASVASWSMTASSARCFNRVIITVEFGTNKVISHILFSLKCHKNGVGGENTIGLVVGR